MDAYKCNQCDEPRTPIVLETDYAYARISNPSFAPYHTVILPKEHRESLETCSDDERRDMDDITMGLKKALANMGYTNFVIWENDGPNRTIKHYHRHLIPSTPSNPPVRIHQRKFLEKEEININAINLQSLIKK
jgi:diadenosine tetraphosphate (Ap4A) HIT family hydrolase